MIYKLIEGAKKWPLSSPFVQADSGCLTKYTLVHKGTDTDVLSEGKWPELTLEDAKDDGNVSFQMKWAAYQWRATHEQTEPEFEIVARGHVTAPQAAESKQSARVGIKAKFIRNCVVDLPATPLTFDNTAQGGTATDGFIIYGYGGKKKFPLSAPF